MKQDRITVTGLDVFARHGVYEQEKEKGQHFLIDLTLCLDLKEAGERDDLARTVDYGKVCTFVSEYASSVRYDLLETLAEELSRALLLRWEELLEVTVTVHKPEAPITVPFRDVAVTLTRKWNEVYLGIGSNLGDKKGYICTALRKLGEHPLIRHVECSSLKITKPYGGVEQDDFLNGAVRLFTLLGPQSLLEFLHRIENEAGRERTEHWGPRTLDLDILFYEDLVMRTPELTIPHPDMANRLFVLDPLMELCPYYVNRSKGLTVREMYEGLKDHV